MRLIRACPPLAMLLLAGVVVTGCATGGSAPSARVPAQAAPATATAAAPAAKSCVLLQNIRQSRVVDDFTIDFYMRDGSVLRNTLPNRCPQLGFERAFTYQTSITQLCSVDLITVLFNSGGIRRGATCGLGSFTPYTPIPTSAK